MDDIRFTHEHEWVRRDQGGVATIGISNHAQQALGDIVFVELPKIGQQVTKGECCATVESTKAASEVMAPVSGQVSEVNGKLVDDPGLVNRDAQGEGWFWRIASIDDQEFASLLEQDP